jgi:RND family efflux transporter MFP subunit
MTRKNKTIFAAAAIVLAGLAIFRILTTNAATDTKRQAAPLVKVESPVRESVLYKLQFTGDMAAVQQANIYAKVGGNLERVYADIGTPVANGQVLALIDTTELYQQYQQASATFENAQANYRRTLELSQQNLVATQEVDNSDAALKVAKANFDLASTRLGYARVTAPFGGYVTKRALDPGALVNANSTSLFTLMDLGSMKVIVDVLEKDIPLIREGRPARVTVDAYPGQEFTGTIRRYAQAVDLSTRTMAVEIDVINRDRLLKPGMFARVSLVVDEHKNAITVPTQSLFSDDSGSYIFIALNDTAKRVPVTIGTEQNSRTEILKGLAGTEKVIVTGQQFVKDGGRVSIQAE